MKRAMHARIAIINVLAIACVVLCCVWIRKSLEASKHHGTISTHEVSRHWIKCSAPLMPPSAFDATLPFQLRPRQQQQQPIPQPAIPSIVHFSFGMADGDDASFGLIQYLSLISALHVLRPQRVLIHYDQQPSGIYWDMLKDHVELEKARKVMSIFGNPISHYAHKADIIRLEALLKYGGIYLDMDVFVLRPFDALLEHNDFVMGREQGIGLCNAVILANKDSPFLKRWYESYRNFQQSDWNRHSVRLPAQMARLYPQEITVLDDHTFFWPLWTEQGRQSIYFGHDYDYVSNLAVHTWNSASGAMLQGLSMASLLECRSSLFAVMRTYVPKNFISVIIVCSSRTTASDAIQTSLQGLLTQSWTHWEAVLVGDRRSIRSCEKAIGRLSKAYPGLEIRRKFGMHMNDTGMTTSLDRGVEAAQGSIVVVLKPGQVIISPDFFLEIERAVAANPRLSVYSSPDMLNGSRVDEPGDDPRPPLYAVRKTAWKSHGREWSALDN